MPHNRNHYPPIGSISSNTLREEDLLPDFAAELAHHIRHMRLTRDQRQRFNTLLRACNSVDFDREGLSDFLDALVSDLIDALTEIAAPYCYFGKAEGDGACFGFWPILGDPDLPRVAAGEPIPREHWNADIYIVNDHGNVACGHVNKRGRFIEYWTCV